MAPMTYPLYESDHDDKWRYVLSSPGNCPLFTVGVNPHKATKTDPDHTVAVVEKLARQAGFDGFVLFNVYPVRSRTVTDLPVVPEPEAMERNAKAIDNILRQYVAPQIWAAWGDDIEQRGFLTEAVRTLVSNLSTLNPTWLHFGDLTNRGHPRHPSRLSHRWQFKEFDASSYCARHWPSPG